MRLGIVQTSPEFGARKSNIEQAFARMDLGTADLWVLPELFATGYQFASREEAWTLSEQIPEGETTRALAGYAQKTGCHLVAGLAERDGDRLYNSAVLVGPEGFVARYRKIHLFYKETLHFDAGNLPFSVVDLGFARVGMMVCFDHLFPESARSLALLGADIICHPANLVMPDLAQRTMTVRALENGVFAATANRIGTEARTEESLTFTGRSQIVAPDGTLLAQASAGHGQIETVEIDAMAARTKALTQFNDKLADRRVDLYQLGPS